MQNFFPEKIKTIYLMGICGTGMGSLAGLLKAKGFDVSGSDQSVYPPMSHELSAQKIKVFSPYSKQNLLDVKPDLVIVGNVISAHFEEAQALSELKIPYVSMPQALNHFFLKDKEVIVVSGTHGKTTTTSLMAWLLFDLGFDPSFLIGGVAQNFGRNFHIGSSKYFVIEGDEYDSAFFDKGPKFLHYNPKHVIMTSLEFDHADIYKDLEHLKTSFKNLAKLIPPDGSLHYCDDYQSFADILPYGLCPQIAYGQMHDYQPQPYGSSFKWPDEAEQTRLIQSPLTGEYNAQNVIACFSVLKKLGVDLSDACLSLQKFKSVKRRQEILVQNRKYILIDDFAHHPTAVKFTLKAMAQKFPNHYLVAIFEPRSATSRRNIFQQEYAQAFKDIDQVYIAPVHAPEKLKHSVPLDVQKITGDLQQAGIEAYCLNSDEIFFRIMALDNFPLCLVVMSNGGFDGLTQRLKTALEMPNFTAPNQKA